MMNINTELIIDENGRTEHKIKYGLDIHVNNLKQIYVYPIRNNLRNVNYVLMGVQVELMI